MKPCPLGKFCYKDMLIENPRNEKCLKEKLKKNVC